MRKVSKVFLGVVFVLVVIVVFMVGVVNPTVANYGKAELEALTIRAVNLGVAQVVTSSIYSELTDIRRNSSGVIVSISADIVEMNRIASEISLTAQSNLDTITGDGIPIPIGTFSGIPILVGKGFPIMLNIQLVGSVTCRFESSFTSAGINQTQHKITLQVDTVVNLVLPLYSKRTTVSVQMLFADSIIVGEVPEFFFHR